MPAARKPGYSLASVVLAVVVTGCLIGGGLGYLGLRILLDMR